MLTEKEVDKLREVISNFKVPSKRYEFYILKRGNINKTYWVVSEDNNEKFILQQINSYVFKEPAKLVHNIKQVTECVREKLDEESYDKALTLIDTTDNKPFLKDEEGEFWRCLNFIEGQVYDHISDDDHGKSLAFEGAKIFGKFQKGMRDVSPDKLHVIIKDFHHTPTRYEQFLEALRNDPYNRSPNCKEEIDFFLSRKYIKEKVGEITNKLPTRVTHNDTKINNVIFNPIVNEKSEERAKAVVDLDTVMPGLVLYDVGDLIRSSTCPVDEDETDLSKVTFSKELYKEILNGYLTSAKNFLTKEEVDHLPYSSILMTYNIGLRFLTDYLNGDIYFATKPGREHHNLERARTQMILLKQLEENYNDLVNIFEELKKEHDV